MFNYIIILISFVFLMLYQFKLSKDEKIILPNILTFYWFFFISLGVLLFCSEYKFNWYGLYWIILLCFVFFNGYILLCKILKKYNNNKSNEIHRVLKPYTKKIIIACILTCMCFKIVGSLFFLLYNDMNPFMLLNPSTFTETFDRLTNMRYLLEDSNIPVIYSFGNLSGYFGVIIFGYYYSYLNHKNIIWTTIIASVLSGVITSAGKAAVIFAIILFLSGRITSIIEQKKNLSYLKEVLNIKVCLYSMVGIFLFFCAFIAMRSKSFNSIFDTLKIYGFGQVPAFDYYFDHLVPNTLSMGKYTFHGLWSILGFHDSTLTQGIYHPIEIGEGNITNVFSAFRSIIDDFGLFGSIIFMAISGAVIAFFQNMINNKFFNPISVGIISFSLAFIFESFVISLGNFLSINFAYFLLVVFVLLINEINERESCKKFVNKLKWIK